MEVTRRLDPSLAMTEHTKYSTKVVAGENMGSRTLYSGWKPALALRDWQVEFAASADGMHCPY
eukprot:3253500-Pleurochrysis_carterae.AAC.4